MIDILSEGAKLCGIDYSNDMDRKFADYRDLLKEWNQKINITRIEEDEDIYIKHFLDSLLFSDVVSIGGPNLIDVGTGGGFPGLPLKIVDSRLKVTLLDSLRKRIDFLEAVVNKLNLTDVEMIHGRAEDYGSNMQYRERYDVCVSRAVAPLNVLCELCLPFVRVGGIFAAYKSENISGEINEAAYAIEALGGKLREIRDRQIPTTDVVRKIIIIDKIKNTGKKYPRKAGKPAKDPIK